MKSQLDERQIQEAARVAGISFYVMYMVCAISIVVQLAAAGHPKNVIGETITLLAGGSVYLIGSVKKGLNTGKSRSSVRILLESAGFSIIFTVFYAFAIRKKSRTRSRDQHCCSSLFYRDYYSLLFHTETYGFHDRTKTQTTGTKICR